jgi:hypothetical protein
MASYYDARSGKTYCGRCDSGSWSVLGDCSACGDGCCDDCATVEGESCLLCARCAAREAECAVEAGYWGDPGWREVFAEGEAA